MVYTTNVREVPKSATFSGVSEMRIDYGPGYRVYFTQRGPIIIVILCGGDKRTQAADIKRAIEIAGKWSG
jgi:putative addiction module killer protein